jgi:hypothetical protein
MMMGGRWLAWGVALALLLLLYVLSYGPALYLVDRTGVGEEALFAAYAPLDWLGERTPLGGPLGRYLGFWDGLAAAAEPAVDPPVSGPLPPPPP